MKKSIFISGIASAHFMLFGSLFKVMHWPGASIFLVLGTFLFCLYFLPAALWTVYKNQEIKKSGMLYLVTFFVFSTCAMGTLFKVMHWPGASIFLLVCIPLPFVLFLPVYLYHTRNESKANTRNFSGIMFGLTFLAVFSVLLALNVSKNVYKEISSSFHLNSKTADFIETEISSGETENSIRKNSDLLFDYIESLKFDLLMASGNEQCVDRKFVLSEPYFEIHNAGSEEIPNRIFYGTASENRMQELKLKIEAYHQVLISSGKANPELLQLTHSLFDVSGESNIHEGATWEETNFSGFQLLLVLNSLSLLQANIRVIEWEYLSMK